MALKDFSGYKIIDLKFVGNGVSAELTKHLFILAFVMLFISTLHISGETALASESEANVELKELRDKIDVINREILVLLNERAKVVFEIGELKARNSMEVYDPGREKEIESKLEQLNTGPLSDEAVIKIFREIISASRELQQTK